MLQALDLVLIPDAASMQLCLEVAQMALPQPNGISLHPKHVVPHLTLGMAVVEHERSVDSLKELGNHLTRGISLPITSVYEANTDVGLVLGLNVEKTAALDNLHFQAWQAFSNLPRLEALSTAILTDAEAADPVTLAWINNFHIGTGPAWNPHVTLGFGPGDLMQFVGQELRFNKLALYQLGGYCTCQRLVWEVEL